jgi:coenzyme F420-0:L-glutamate ligase/coenzyme F420-1:gamma-L-glutamate ligase
LTTLSAVPIEGLPEIGSGDDLGALLTAAHRFETGELLVLSHKVVSKAEGRTVTLSDVSPSPRALDLAHQLGKDPRHVEVVLSQTSEIIRAVGGVLICRTHQGLVCANAGVDASNASDGELVLLPEDPDNSARRLRAALGVPVVIADSFGRAWRHGQCEVAIGIAGLAPLDDWRGRSDSSGRELTATVIAIADQAAAAADLARDGKDSGHPAVVVRGLERYFTDGDGPGAAALIRPPEEDLFGK